MPSDSARSGSSKSKRKKGNVHSFARKGRIANNCDGSHAVRFAYREDEDSFHSLISAYETAQPLDCSRPLTGALDARWR